MGSTFSPKLCSNICSGLVRPRRIWPGHRIAAVQGGEDCGRSPPRLRATDIRERRSSPRRCAWHVLGRGITGNGVRGIRRARGRTRRRPADRLFAIARCITALANGPPFVFLDRSLGRIQVPRLLRAAGIELVTLAEHDGRPQDESVEDTTWIVDAASRGWISFMKDHHIRRRPAERAAIKASKAQCFCLANASLKADDMARRYLENLGAIARASAFPGPFLYAVHASRMERLSLDEA